MDPDDLADYIGCYFTIPSCSGADFNEDGHADVWAEESLSVSVAGSGDVRYKGEPKKVEQSIAGSGSVKRVKWRRP